MPYRPLDPDTTDVTRALIEDAMARMEGPGPGRVQSYDPATQTADVVPLLRLPIPQGDGSNAFEDGPVVPHVPVIFQRAGGFGVVFPVAPGDMVLLVPCGGDLGTWFAGDGGITTPADLRRHHLAHAVAIPGLFPRTSALAHAPAAGGNLVVGNDTAAADGGTMEIAPDGNVVLNKGTLHVARESDGLNVGTLVATAGPYPVLFTYVAGTPGAAPSPAPPGGVSLQGVIAPGGASKVKA